MKAQVDQGKLKHALNNCSRITSGRASLQILQCVYIKTEKSKLVIQATNLEVATSTNVAAKIHEDGAICVPAKIISEFVSSLPNGEVTLETKDGTLKLENNGYKATINTVDSNDFPELPVTEIDKSIKFELATNELKEIIDQVQYATSSDTTRPVLTGVYWHIADGFLYLVGTDGYRLSERRGFASNENISVIIPHFTLSELVRTMDESGEVEIFISDSQITFITGSTTLISQLIEGKYPDYRQIIPKTNNITVKVKTSDVIGAVKIAGLFSRDSGNSITVEASAEKNSLIISSIASEVGDNSTAIECMVSGSGVLNINASYLLDALGVIKTEKAVISFDNTLSPLKITPDTKEGNITCVVMPLKS